MDQANKLFSVALFSHELKAFHLYLIVNIYLIIITLLINIKN